jgi:hypothetical protein
MNTAFRQDFRVVVQGLLDVNRGAMSLLVHVARRPSSHDQIIALQSLASSAAPLLGTMTSLVVVGGRWTEFGEVFGTALDLRQERARVGSCPPKIPADKG